MDGDWTGIGSHSNSLVQILNANLNVYYRDAGHPDSQIGTMILMMGGMGGGLMMNRSPTNGKSWTRFRHTLSTIFIIELENSTRNL